MHTKYLDVHVLGVWEEWVRDIKGACTQVAERPMMLLEMREYI